MLWYRFAVKQASLLLNTHKPKEMFVQCDTTVAYRYIKKLSNFKLNVDQKIYQTFNMIDLTNDFRKPCNFSYKYFFLKLRKLIDLPNDTKKSSDVFNQSREF